jgi:hypothetical protein
MAVPEYCSGDPGENAGWQLGHRVPPYDTRDGTRVERLPDCRAPAMVIAWAAMQRLYLAAGALIAVACGRAASSNIRGAADAGDTVAFDGSGADASSSGSDAGVVVGPSTYDAAAGLGSTPTLADFCSALVLASSQASAAANPQDCNPITDPADVKYAGTAYCDVMAREVDAGNLLYHPSQAAACVTAAFAAGASPSRDIDVPDCRAAVTGQLGTGQSCHYGSPLELSVGIGFALDGRPLITTCAAGLFCGPIAADGGPVGQACDGTCAAIGQLDEPCPTAGGCDSVFCAGPCEPGSVCAASGSSLLCQPRPTQGESCNYTGLEMCADGLYCSPTGSDGPGICQPQLPSSATCALVLDECTLPNICCSAPGSDGGARCIAQPLLQPGEACSSSAVAQCVCPGQCFNLTCIAALDAGGSPCMWYTDVLPCRGGTCNPAEGDGGTCVAYVPPGQPCDPNFGAECGWETCDPVSKRCIPTCFSP